MKQIISRALGASFAVGVLLSACTIPAPPVARVTPAAQHAAPVVNTQSPQPQDKIQNAMSAGPAMIAKDAAIMDYPATPGGKLVELRKGSNGWTCIPDDPVTPTNDPLCLDKVWLAWFEAYLAGAEPKVTAPGVIYALQGGSAASNSDPFATAPPAGKDWEILPSHVAFIFPGKLDAAAFPSEHHGGGPWIMYGGTPYEHVMVPLPDAAK